MSQLIPPLPPVVYQYQEPGSIYLRAKGNRHRLCIADQETMLMARECKYMQLSGKIVQRSNSL